MTAQVPERLVLDDCEVDMTACPPLPLGHPRCVKRAPDDPPVPGIVHSTACWRHYIGTWRIDGDRLYLVGIEGDYRLIGDEPLFADWVSGDLIVPRGRMLEYVHMGFASRYESETVISVFKGLVTKREEIGPERKRRIDRMLAGLPDESEDHAATGWRVQIVEGPGAGETFEFVAGIYPVGRNRSNRMVLDFGDTHIAAHEHMRFIQDYQEDALYAHIGKAPHLARLNGEAILAPVALKPGDIIALGETKLKVSKA